MPKTKQAQYEQRLVNQLKEYDDQPGTTVIDGIVAVIAELQIRVDSLENQARMESRVAREVSKEIFGQVIRISVNEFDWSEYKERVSKDRDKREAAGEDIDLKAGQRVVELTSTLGRRLYLSREEWGRIKEPERIDEAD